MERIQDLTRTTPLWRITRKSLAWISLSRPPFHTVGILPFCLGTYLAWKTDGIFLDSFFFLGALAVFLILLSTYHAGEYFDYKEDSLSKAKFNSRFSGGSGIMPAKILARRIPLVTSIVAILLAGGVGLILQFVYRTGPYTLLLGCLGALSGFFYSTKPIRLVERGCGELFIAFCYGWLPVATAFYLQAGYFHPLVHWISPPIALTIFNVILLNEFPDYEADKSVGKRNLLVRLGWEKGMLLFIMVSVAAWITILASIYGGVPLKVLHVYVPVFFISLLSLFLIFRNWHRKLETLEILCGMNIAVNLGTTGAFIYALS